jgi:hypothetical protein
MKLAPSMVIFVLATAIFLCSLATTASLVYASHGSGLSKAKENTCGSTNSGKETACGQICGFTRCVSLEVKNGDDLLHS